MVLLRIRIFYTRALPLTLSYCAPTIPIETWIEVLIGIVYPVGNMYFLRVRTYNDEISDK